MPSAEDNSLRHLRQAAHRRGARYGALALLAACALILLPARAQAQGTFTRHLTITVGAGVVGGPHANFPVLVDVTNADLANPTGSVQSPNGYDIVFRGEDGGICGGPASCMLDHEIDLYDGAAGRVVAWVRVPSLAAGRIIHLYYGNSAITTPTAASGSVFDADYVGVWHLGQTGAGTPREYRDSSPYGNHGQGGQGEANAVPKRVPVGKIGGAQRFDKLVDGIYDFIDAGQDASLHITGNQITLEAWVWHSIVPNTAHGITGSESVSNPYGILNAKGWAHGYRLHLLGNPFGCPNPNGGAGGLTAPCLSLGVPEPSGRLQSSQYGSPVATDPVTAGAWHHVVGSYDGAEMKLFLNGQKLIAQGNTLYTVGTASVGAGLTIVTFVGATLPASIGAGDVLTFVGSPVENIVIASRDSATQVTLQTPAAVAHAAQGYRITNPHRTSSLAPSMAEQHVWIGHGDQPQNRSWSAQFEGDLDEVRISRIARSDSWIATQYNNQNAPGVGGFYSSVTGPVGAALTPNATVNFRSIGDTTPYATGSGTCTATLGAVVVSCPGASWLSANRGLGDRITIDTVDYTVLAVDSETSLRLTEPFAGTSGIGNKSYTMTRKFSNLVTWENCVDGGAPPACENAPTASLVADNRREVGILYADGSAYTPSGANPIVNFAGATTNPAHTVLLTVAPGNRHLGVPDVGNTGVVLDNTGNTVRAVWVQMDHVTLEWLEIKGGSGPGIEFGSAGDTLGAANLGTVRDNLIHDVGGAGILVSDPDTIVDIHNNFIFNSGNGIRLGVSLAAGGRVNVLNNTIYNSTTGGVTSRDGGGAAVRQALPRVTLRNNIVHSSGTTDIEIAGPFDEAYFCTGVDGSQNPTGCGADMAAALGDETTNEALSFTGTDTSCLYLGSSQQFRSVGVAIPVAPTGSGAYPQWHYWDGSSWASLETGMFAGYNFQWDGFSYWADDPAPPWTTRTVGGGATPRYYARICRAGTDNSPTVSLITRADANISSRYNLTTDKSGFYNSLWRGVGGTGLQDSGGTGVLFNSATDLHIQAGSMARDKVLDVQRQDGGWEASALTERLVYDIDNQVRPITAAGSCTASNANCWDIGADEYGATTAVKLQSFSALPGDGSVVLEWRTASELDNLGFHVYRGLSEGGPWTRLSASLIPGLGSSAVGQAYSFLDSGLTNGTRYFYRLEDVDAASKTTSHGPVSAVPAAGAAAGGANSGTNGGGIAKKRDTSSGSCPDWVLTAYSASSGSSSSASLSCTRHGEPEAVSLNVLSRDTRQATLELRTGGFYSLREASGGVRVFVPGFNFPSDPQAAALPFRRALVEAIVGRRVELGGARAMDQVAFPGLVPGALGKAEMQVSWDGTVRAGRRGIRAPVSRGASADLVRLLPSVFQGETKSAVVEISPLRFDAQRKQLLLARRVRLRLLFTGRETAEGGRGHLGRKPTPQKRASGELLARLYTTSRGLYAVSFDRLFPGRRRGLLASELRLERQGEAQAFHLEPASGSFGPGGVLYFHADTEAASTDFSSETAFELVLSRDGLRMPLASAAPSGEVVASASIRSARFETNRFYQPGLLDAEDPWQWEGLASGTTRAMSFTLSGVSGSAAQAAELEVFLQGASESGRAVDHHVSVSVNGTLAGEAWFAGKQPYRMTLSVPAALLREGANELQLTNVADTGVSSYVFLDRFTLSYPQTSSLTSGVFEGTWADSGTATVSGTAAALLDVTAASAGARWLAGFEAVGGALRFRAEAGHRYLAVSPQGLLTPRVAAAAASSLRATTNQADYLLIAPSGFLAAAEPLLERRRDQGLQARAVSFEEIADAFGHGQPSAEAIRSFLGFAFHSWARPSPRYVLLLGDSTYDPRNFSGSARPSPLPALWTKTSYLWTASDPLLAAVNGEDALPDLAIGRLPAATVAEAERLVAKLLAWEDSGQGLSGAAALVADNPDLAGDFEADVRDIAACFLSERNPRLLLLRELGAGTRPAIQDALNSGLGLLSYVGHGGAAVWASENVWNSWDAASLQAQSRQPLLLTLNCLNGYFVAPAFDSLTESLLKAEGRGAIAGFSPSGLSLDGPAHQYHRALMAELTSGRHERLGDALTAAQRAYAQTGLMPELLSVYHLLGDPAMRVRP